MSPAHGESSRAPASPERPTLVATIGLDEATSALVVAAAIRADSFAPPRSVRGESTTGWRTPELEVRGFADLDAARDALDRMPRQRVILVTDGGVLRKRRSFPADVYVLALVGPSAPTDIEADDVLRRPFEQGELGARLVAAARQLDASRRATVRAVLREAIDARASGEVIVSLGAEAARVHLDQGRFVWLHRTPQPTSIRTLIAAWGLEVDDATWRDVLEESRVSRRHFCDVLVEWGMVDREKLRSALQHHLRVELGALLASPVATANFVLENRSFTSTLAFDEHEVMTAAAQRRIETHPELPAFKSLPPPPSAPRAHDWFERMAAIPDLVGCALMDARTGAVVERQGSFDEREAWSLVAAFAALGDDAAEVVATSRSATYLVRSGNPFTNAVLAARFDARAVSPAMARLLVAKTIEAAS